MAATSFDQRHQNDLAGLTWIHRFGWLRSQELGGLLWPRDAYARTRADRVIRGWLARNLIIARKLPEGAGRAVVLSEAGARLLRNAGIEASTGKDWGETDAHTWRPDRDWRHDLIAAGVLVDVHARGATIVTERQIRAANELTKIPDGLIITPKYVAWLEVEQARKTGKAMAELAEALAIVASGHCKPVSGHRPTLPILAYAEGAMDERGMNLDHRGRVRTAVAKAVNQDVQVIWAKCTMAGCGVASVRYEQELIQSDRAAAIVPRLEWRPGDNGCLVASYGQHTCYIWDAEDMKGWGYTINDEPADVADTKAAAIRACAARLAAK